MKIEFFYRLTLLAMSTLVLDVSGQEMPDSNTLQKFGQSVKNIHALTHGSPEYQKEALGLIIAEANRVAQELPLLETLPITESN